MPIQQNEQSYMNNKDGINMKGIKLINDLIVSFIEGDIDIGWAIHQMQRFSLYNRVGRRSFTASHVTVRDLIRLLSFPVSKESPISKHRRFSSSDGLEPVYSSLHMAPEPLVLAHGPFLNSPLNDFNGAIHRRFVVSAEVIHPSSHHWIENFRNHFNPASRHLMEF